MAHSFSYVNGEISATGISDVKEFVESETVAQLESEIMTWKGSNLKIGTLDRTDGKLRVTVTLHSLQYGAAQDAAGFFKLLFKGTRRYGRKR